MLRPMAEVVFEMVALRFERIVVFILHFPSGATCLYDGCHGFGGERGLGHKGIVVEVGPLRIRERKFTPINVQRIGAGAQRQMRSVAIRRVRHPRSRVHDVSDLMKIFA